MKSYKSHHFTLAGVIVEPHKKQLHVSLAYQFPTDMKEKLEVFAKAIQVDAPVRWDIRLYSRDPHFAKCQVSRTGVLTNYGLTLCLLFFQREHKHIFTFYVIPPHWFDTGSWNPSSSRTGTYLFYLVNIMAADVLVMQGARASATMILT